MKYDDIKKYFGFTLAEILITLTILGVVAAVTIPSLIHKFQDRLAITKVKKAYSLLDNALQIATVIEGPFASWAWHNDPNDKSNDYDVDNQTFLVNTLSKYLDTKEICTDRRLTSSCKYAYKPGYGSTKHYFQDISGKSLSAGPDITNKPYIVLKNGTFLFVSFRSFVNEPNFIIVDINGKKDPNRYGYDVFSIFFDINGIKTNTSYYCSFNKKENCIKQCNPTVNGGFGATCTYWIFKHNNMDYKYRDVSVEW